MTNREAMSLFTVILSHNAQDLSSINESIEIILRKTISHLGTRSKIPAGNIQENLYLDIY